MNREKALETIIVLALALLVASIMFEVTWLNYVSILLLAMSFISKQITIYISKIWFTFSEYLGIVMNYIIMFFIFYCFLCPISFFQRLFEANQILKKMNSDSYFIKRNHRFIGKDIDKPW